MFYIAPMPLPDTMFCAQQIDIAQELPDILKNFTKAAVRTQPEDLLLWSAAYFTALSKGERLPVKDRLELNVTHKTDSAMTPGLLKTLHKQKGEGLIQKAAWSRDQTNV
uniref:ropporin-1-like protein n=1 Tax=Gasterosteus aculeatus aculeatus TaxID=481459 RepID=UPI001A97F53E|nr:ropporin-1-like protein [Gasterosteus aculeatus aculeatus]